MVVDKATLGQSIVIGDCLESKISIKTPKVNHILIDRFSISSRLFVTFSKMHINQNRNRQCYLGSRNCKLQKSFCLVITIAHPVFKTFFSVADGGKFPTVQVDLSSKVDFFFPRIFDGSFLNCRSNLLNLFSFVELGDTRFVTCSSSDMYLHFTDLKLKFLVPTSLLQVMITLLSLLDNSLL